MKYFITFLLGCILTHLYFVRDGRIVNVDKAIRDARIVSKILAEDPNIDLENIKVNNIYKKRDYNVTELSCVPEHLDELLDQIVKRLDKLHITKNQDRIDFGQGIINTMTLKCMDEKYNE